MGFHYAERHHRAAKRRELEGGRLMLRAGRFLTLVLVLLFVFVAGLGLVMQVSGNAPPQGCWKSSCWHDER